MDKQPIYSLKIVNTETKSDIVYYQITVVNIQTKTSWVFSERYKNLLALHTSLKDALTQDLPKFPEKKFFGNTDPEFISTRKASLQNYFKTLLLLVDVDSVPILKSFLTKGESRIIRENNQSIFQSETPIQVQQQQQDAPNKDAAKKKKWQLQEQQKAIIRQQLSEQCDLTKQNFIGLVPISAPEENEVKRKRQIYDKITIQDKDKEFPPTIPNTNLAAKTQLGNQTLVAKNRDLFDLLDQMNAKLDQIILD